MHQIPSNVTHVKTALDSKIMKMNPLDLAAPPTETKTAATVLQ